MTMNYEKNYDSFGYVVTTRRKRGPGCVCLHPCKKFSCTHPGHVGLRATPWCRGHDLDDIDRLGAWCDDCWYTEMLSQGIER